MMRKSIRERLLLPWLVVAAIATWLVMFPDDMVKTFFFWECYLLLIGLCVVHTMQSFMRNPYNLTREPPVTSVMQVYDNPVLYTIMVDFTKVNVSSPLDYRGVSQMVRYLSKCGLVEANRKMAGPKVVTCAKGLTTDGVDALFCIDMPPFSHSLQIRVLCERPGSYPITYDEWIEVSRIRKLPIKDTSNVHSIPQRGKSNA